MKYFISDIIIVLYDKVVTLNQILNKINTNY